MAVLARRLGCSEGQVYTLVLGLTFALLLALSGVSVPVGSRLADQPTTPIQTGQAATLPRSQAAGSGATAPVAVVSYPLNTPPSTTLPVEATGPVTTGSQYAPGSPAPVSPATTTIPNNIFGPSVFARVGPPGAPGGLAVGPGGRVFVTTDNGTARGDVEPSAILEFDSSGQSAGQVTITGQAVDHVDGLGAAAVSPLDRAIYVVDIDSARIIRVSPTSGIQSFAFTVPNLKPCPLVLDQPPCEPGVVDHPPSPSALAFDDHGNLYITDAGQGTIWRWRVGETAPTAWYQSTDLATGDGPAGIAVDPLGSVLFTVGTSLDASNPDAGNLYSLTVDADGNAGGRTLVAKFSPSDRPGPIAVDSAGSIYTILRGTGAIVTIRGGTASSFPTQGTSVPLDGPSGLAIDNGRLLVANESASNDPAHWAVLSFPLQ